MIAPAAVGSMGGRSLLTSWASLASWRLTQAWAVDYPCSLCWGHQRVVDPQHTPPASYPMKTFLFSNMIYATWSFAPAASNEHDGHLVNEWTLGLNELFRKAILSPCNGVINLVFHHSQHVSTYVHAFGRARWLSDTHFFSYGFSRFHGDFSYMILSTRASSFVFMPW